MDAEPGTVMVIDEAGLLRPSAMAYDSRVVGVISGAGAYKPGILLISVSLAGNVGRLHC